MKEFRKLSPCAVPMGSRRAKTVCISRSLGRPRLRCGSGSARDRRLLHSAGCGKEHGQRETNCRNLLHTYRLLIYQDAGNMEWVSQKRGEMREICAFPHVGGQNAPERGQSSLLFSAERRFSRFSSQRMGSHATSSSGGRSHHLRRSSSPVSSSSKRFLINRAGLPPATV